jgi:hypothetical protein
MSKLLTPICAALLLAGLAACNRSGNDDEARLNKAANLLNDNSVYDTSADDAALNEADLPRDEGAAPANEANAAAAGNAAAGTAQ